MATPVFEHPAALIYRPATPASGRRARITSQPFPTARLALQAAPVGLEWVESATAPNGIYRAPAADGGMWLLVACPPAPEEDDTLALDPVDAKRLLLLACGRRAEPATLPVVAAGLGVTEGEAVAMMRVLIGEGLTQVRAAELMGGVSLHWARIARAFVYRETGTPGRKSVYQRRSTAVEVARYEGRGMTAQQIADELGVSRAAVVSARYRDRRRARPVG